MDAMTNVSVAYEIYISYASGLTSDRRTMSEQYHYGTDTTCPVTTTQIYGISAGLLCG